MGDHPNFLRPESYSSAATAMVTILHESKNLEKDETQQTNTYCYLERGIQLKIEFLFKTKTFQST